MVFAFFLLGTAVFSNAFQLDGKSCNVRSPSANGRTWWWFRRNTRHWTPKWRPLLLQNFSHYLAISRVHDLLISLPILITQNYFQSSNFNVWERVLFLYIYKKKSRIKTIFIIHLLMFLVKQLVASKCSIIIIAFHRPKPSVKVKR